MNRANHTNPIRADSRDSSFSLPEQQAQPTLGFGIRAADSECLPGVPATGR